MKLKAFIRTGTTNTDYTDHPLETLENPNRFLNLRDAHIVIDGAAHNPRHLPDYTPPLVTTIRQIGEMLQHKYNRLKKQDATCYNALAVQSQCDLVNLWLQNAVFYEMILKNQSLPSARQTCRNLQTEINRSQIAA